MEKQEYMDIYFSKYVPLIVKITKGNYRVKINLSYIMDMEDESIDSTYTIGYIVRINSVETMGVDFIDCLVRCAERALGMEWLLNDEKCSFGLHTFNALAMLYIDYEGILKSYETHIASNPDDTHLYNEKSYSVRDMYIRAFNHILTLQS